MHSFEVVMFWKSYIDIANYGIPPIKQTRFLSRLASIQMYMCIIIVI